MSSKSLYRVLDDYEKFWLACEPWLKEKGYLLRPRYRPGWVPSWSATDEEGPSWSLAEDGQVGSAVTFMDGERVRDGVIVYFKKLNSKAPNHINEIAMNRRLASEPFASDPRNHCVPCYNIFQVPEAIAKDTILVVMPFLALWWRPGFETVGEVMEFFRQALEGLHCLHSHHIAHNDIKANNILMDHSPLYNVPPHPIMPIKSRDWSSDVTPLNRTDRPLHYYLIDFDLAEQYDPKSGPHLRDPWYGGDKSVPEFERDEQCDPFAVDVYRLANIFKNSFTVGGLNDKLWPKRRGLEFMDQLLNAMTDPDPKKRPTMDEAMKEFMKILRSLSWQQLRGPLWIAKDPPPGVGSRAWISHWRKQMRRIVRRIPAIPTPKPIRRETLS